MDSAACAQRLPALDKDKGTLRLVMDMSTEAACFRTLGQCQITSISSLSPSILWGSGGVWNHGLGLAIEK